MELLQETRGVARKARRRVATLSEVTVRPDAGFLFTRQDAVIVCRQR